MLNNSELQDIRDILQRGKSKFMDSLGHDAMDVIDRLWNHVEDLIATIDKNDCIRYCPFNCGNILERDPDNPNECRAHHRDDMVSTALCEGSYLPFDQPQ